MEYNPSTDGYKLAPDQEVPSRMGASHWRPAWGWASICLVLFLLIAVIAVSRNLLVVYGPLELRPSIVCNETGLDAGEICGPKQVKFDFLIRNQGGTNLTVSKALGGCRCLTVSSPKFPQVIEAGKSLQLSTVMDLKGVSGAFKKRLLIASDDPLLPRLELSVKGVVCAPSQVPAASPGD